jgi:hypothetical protein
MKEPLLVHSTLKRLVLLVAIFVYFLAAGTARANSVPSANSVPNCTPGMSVPSLQQSGGCKAGNLLFTNFGYQWSGAYINCNGVMVVPSNILVNATPFSVTFSTDYGRDGGFADGCAPEDDAIITYDVSVIDRDEQIAGLGLFGGVQGPAAYSGAFVSEIGCLGAGNIESGTISINFGVAFYGALSQACPQNPSNSVLLNATLVVTPNCGVGQPGCETVNYPRVALFAPVSTMNLAFRLYVAGGSDLTSFTNAFFFVSHQNNQGNQNN